MQNRGRIARSGAADGIAGGGNDGSPQARGGLGCNGGGGMGGMGESCGRGRAAEEEVEGLEVVF